MQTTIKTKRFLRKCVFISLSMSVLGLIVACSEDTGNQEISQKIKAHPKKQIVTTPKAQPATQDLTETVVKPLENEK